MFGVKGGGTGGGYSQVMPMEDINLHFNGDSHAVTAAHSLLAAALDASIFNGNPLRIDPLSITWPRTVDMNDRELRYSVVGLGGKAHGIPRQNEFVITAASEVMAVFALAHDLKDLRQRLGRIVVASTVRRPAGHGRAAARRRRDDGDHEGVDSVRTSCRRSRASRCSSTPARSATSRTATTRSWPIASR